jgi:RimJ/RimL family protein N-acetyltransferase
LPSDDLLRTARLELVPCSLEAARASLRDRTRLEALIGRSVPESWPPGELVDALSVYARALESDRSQLGWGVWLVMAPHEGSLVGSAGFKGPPDRRGCVEIGYGIEALFRRRGYAREAVAALVGWAWERGARRIVAECHQANADSIKVLRHVGMSKLQARGQMLWWELWRPS